ncbi:MAG: hypothetical protein HY906_18985 [Deltaproteobacteria bacterium]|nr:hypothetical protein [Deltaproteobacteria bacterium]
MPARLPVVIVSLVAALVVALVAACGGPECSDDLAECSADALTLTVCEGGKRRAIACMADQGRLCEGGACVDPGDCTEDRRTIEPPTDYLLAYWMGRHYGFIGEND